MQKRGLEMKWCFILIVTCGVLAGQVEIGLIRNFESSLRYLNGNCSWRLTIEGTATDVEVSVAPERTIVGTDATDGVIWKCVVGGRIALFAIFEVYDTHNVPAPKNLTLDSQILSWSNVLQPSNLPPEFELTHEMSVSYLVTVRNREGGERGQTLISHETSLDISRLLDYCKRQEFNVQTVISNRFYSQNSSYLTNPSVPVILDALLFDNITLKVLFDMEERQCVSQLHIVIDGLVDISFNVTISDRDRGEVTYDLSPYISPEDVCTVRGVVYGSNDTGDSSTQVHLQSPGGCSLSGTDSLPTSSTVSESSSSPTDKLTPTLTNPTSPPTSTSPTMIVAVTVTVVVILLVLAAIIVVLIFFLIIRRRRKRKGKDSDVTGDVSLQTNEAYCTVTTGVPMKRNEAYESVLRTETDSSNTQHTYETVATLKVNMAK